MLKQTSNYSVPGVAGVSLVRAAYAAAMLVGGFGSATPAASAATGRPNVVLIVSDDMGYHDFGFQGSKDVPTPNLDALADHGVRFSNAYVTAPICGASRAGLLSGRYQQRESYESNPRVNEGLALGQATLADAFRQAGYATGAVGKWSVGQGEAYRPLKRGFDEFFGFLGMMHAYVPGEVPQRLHMVGETPRPGWSTAEPQRESTSRPAYTGGGVYGGTGAADAQTTIGVTPGHFVRGDAEIVENGYATEAFAREAVRFVDAHQDRPFFLYLAFNASHSPLQPPQAYLDRVPGLSGKRQLYAATTLAMDDAVGVVVGELNRLGVEKNTVIAFINDNGGPINDIAADNAPLSGAKQSLWEGGIRVPLLLHWTGHLPEHVTRPETVISLDLFPTLLAAAGVPTPPGKQFEGRNVWPTLTGTGGPETASRTLFWRFNDLWAVREGRWKLTVPQARVPRPLLFDLESDVGENTDVAARHPDVVARLTQAWTDWNAKNKPVPPTNGPTSRANRAVADR